MIDKAIEVTLPWLLLMLAQIQSHFALHHGHLNNLTPKSLSTILLKIGLETLFLREII
jgi:hypothetical protein